MTDFVVAAVQNAAQRAIEQAEVIRLTLVDQAFKGLGLGLGGALLADALDRAARSEIAAYALMVDAKDEAAAAFYQHHGFIALPDAPRTLFLPLATIQPSRNSPFSAS